MLPPCDLPEPILDCALGLLTGAEGAARDTALAALLAAHPAHAEALRALDRALQATDRLLAHTGTRTGASDPVQIGSYRVLRKLGEGAFGVVYLCAQEAPIRRHVAVKVLRPGAGDAGTLARFEAERQLLVGFDHPSIAGLIDAGALPDGRPYFTMEHVDGVPISHYCDQNRLPVEARLRLFAALCEGVAHAHARGIVHRDLKPANVLVVERDGRPVPKIIDFGIAKALHPVAAGAVVERTTTGRVIGTPGYMSPEQAAGNAADVDPRADVFALGVMLYELLVGSRPWDGRTPTTDSEPPRPSTRVKSDAARATTVADLRSTELRTLVSTLREELDWVVLKALQQRRELRYRSAQELADDLQRYLRGDAVDAGPPSVATHLRKMARRHRTMVAVAAAVVVLGAAGAAVASWFHGEALASTAARLADAETAVKQLVERAYDQRLWDAPSGDDLRRELLEDALAVHDRVLRERSSDPDHRWLRVLLLNRLADVCFHFAQYAQSIEWSVEAESEGEELLRLQPERVTFMKEQAVAQRNLARCNVLLGNPTDARTWSDRALALLERMYAQDAAGYANLLAGMLLERASVLRFEGDLDGERGAQSRAIATLERHLESHPDHAVSQRDLVRALCGLCGMLQRDGRTAEAEAAVSQARSLAATLTGITDEERGLVHRRLGYLYAGTSRAHEAVAELTAAVAVAEKLAQLHAGRKMVYEQLRELRTLLYEQQHRIGEFEAADAQAEPAVADAEALAPDYPGWQGLLADTLSKLAWAAVSAGRDRPVDAWIERCLELTESDVTSNRHAKAARERAAVTRRFAAIRSDLRDGRLDVARQGLRSVTRQLSDADYLLHASCCWADLAARTRAAEPPDEQSGAAAEDAAIEALGRAIESGFADRRRLLVHREFAPLQSRPAFRELLARLPE